MTLLQALIIAVVQGATELFPVSSLGHAVILPALLNWHFDESATSFLPFLVVLHLGTVVALLLFFWRDWWELALALFGFGPEELRPIFRRLIVMIIVATIPAVVVGGAFEKLLKHLFGTPAVAASFLIVNGIILFAAERLRRRSTRQGGGYDLDQITGKDALIIGLWQCLALIPGISRSGSTMVGGLLRGLNHEASAHFSFLIATPIILGAAVLEVPKLVKSGVGVTDISILAGVVSGVVAYLSVWILMRYFKKTEFQALDPFAYYCWAAGALTLVALAFGI